SPPVLSGGRMSSTRSTSTNSTRSRRTRSSPSSIAAASTSSRRRRRKRRRAGPSPAPDLLRDDDGRVAALPARGRSPRPSDRGAGGRAREEDRARRHGGEAAHDPVEPPPGRLDREELPQPRTAVPRPDPGGNARADQGGREVRLATWVQVLDVRDLVDPAG